MILFMRQIMLELQADFRLSFIVEGHAVPWGNYGWAPNSR